MIENSPCTRILTTLPLTLLACCIASCNGNSSTSNTASPSSGQVIYTEHPIKAEQQSAGFIGIGDLDGNSDNGLEILLSTLVEQTPPGPPTALSRCAYSIPVVATAKMPAASTAHGQRKPS